MDRKKVSGEWHKILEIIQARIQASLPDLFTLINNPNDNQIDSQIDNHALADIIMQADMNPNKKENTPKAGGGKKEISYQDIDYEKCEKIVEYLVKTEGELNLFRQYTSPRVKNWVQIKKAFQKDGVYLAAYAATFQKVYLYEIPALKKQAQQLQSQIQDCDKIESDLSSSIISLKNKFKNQCAELKIKGDSIKQELLMLPKEIPAIFLAIGKEIQSGILASLIIFYSEFLNFAFGDANYSQNSNPLPLLTFLQENGNTTCHYYKTGKEPKYADAINENTDLTLKEPSEPVNENVSDTIDWDIDLAPREDAKEVKPGIPQEKDAKEKVIAEITTENAQKIEENEQTEENDIDWEIEIEPSDKIESGKLENLNLLENVDSITLEKLDIQLEESGFSLQETLLENNDFRNLLLDELYELEAFLNQWISEMSASSSSSSQTSSIIDVYQNAPPIIQSRTIASCTALLNTLKRFLSNLTNQRLHNLILIRDSPKFADRLTTNLKQTLSLQERAERKLLSNKSKKGSFNQQLVQVQGKIRQQLEESKRLRDLLQKHLSILNNRIVNIVG